MDLTSSTKALVLKYFNAWPRQRWDEMRACLADRIEFDGGRGAVSQDADAFTEHASNGAPWRDVTLVQSVFQGEHAALLYEAIDTGSNARMRVGEFVTVGGGKIQKIEAAIVKLG